MKKNIKWVVLAIVVILYIVIALGVNGKIKIKTKSTNYLIVGNNLIWHEKNGKWYQLTEVTDDLLKQKFTVYNGNDKYTADIIQYSRKWYFFDKDYNELPNDDFKIAYSGNKKVTVPNYNIETYDSSDEQYINTVVNKIAKGQLEMFKNSSRKITLDFDNDGEEETIYITSNYMFAVVNYDFYSYVFLVKNGNVVNKIGAMGSNPFNYVEILDIGDDKKYEIVISKGVKNLETFESCYQIYKVVNNKLTLSQDCLKE